MLRTFKFWLKPNRAQEEILLRWLSQCCDLYNAGLQQRIAAWRYLRRVTMYEQFRELTELRAAEPEWKSLPVLAARSALRRLDFGFQSFFRRCRSGERPGHPRFRSRSRYDSFSVGRARVEYGRVKLPTLGWVKFKAHRSLEGEVREVRVIRGAKRWHVCIVCSTVAPPPPKRAIASACGIDLGICSFVTLHDGSKADNPRWFRASERVLASRQRSLERKKRNSASAQRARNLIARGHERVRNQRRDFHCKLAKALVEDFDLIAHEDLNMKFMLRSTLAKSVHDAGWSSFLRILQRKAEEAGVWAIPVDPRGTTKRCSSCGTSTDKTLAERTHTCPDCGLVMDRDQNAAINILALGLSAIPADAEIEASLRGRALVDVFLHRAPSVDQTSFV